MYCVLLAPVWRPVWKEKIMKKTTTKVSDGLQPEYKFDYTKAKPNRFAGRMGDRTVVVLDPDVAEVFTTPDSVNAALRALISAMPKDRIAGHAVKEE
jgi:hypothetical protein